VELAMSDLNPPSQLQSFPLTDSSAVSPTQFDLGSLSLRTLLINMSNAFVGTIKDIFDGPITGAHILKTVEKDKRYMYLALLVIILLISNDVLRTMNL
jgi:hypothetical protein